MRQLFLTKCGRSLLQNASGFLLQIDTILLQNVTVVTKRDGCCKLQQYVECMKQKISGGEKPKRKKVCQ